MNILHIDSACLGDNSASRQLTAAVIDALRNHHWDANVAYRDLSAAPLTHVTGPLLQVLRGQWNNAIPLNDELQAESLLTELLLAEFMAADMIVVGAPMFTLGIPSTLKTWLDRVVVEGRTFETGPGGQTKGLASGKRVVLVATQGGPADPAAGDFHAAFLHAVFRQVGIRDISVVRADSLALGPKARTAAINDALKQVAALSAQ